MRKRRTPVELAAGDMQERARAARRQDCPPGLLAQLAVDPEETVRLALTKRHKLPVEAALVLAVDISRRVRKSLAAFPSNPSAAMVLTADDDHDIRLRARSSAWVQAYWTALANGDGAAEQRLATWLTAQDADHELLQSVMSSGILPTEVLRDLTLSVHSGIASEALRMIVTDPKSGPQDIQFAVSAIKALLSADISGPSYEVEVSRHQNCPRTILAVLCRHQMPAVAVAAMANGNCPRFARIRACVLKPSLRYCLRRTREWQRGDHTETSYAMRVHTANRQWEYFEGAPPRMSDAREMRRFLVCVLNDRRILRRYSAASDLARHLRVRFDRRFRRLEGKAYPPSTIRVNPSFADLGLGIHEVTHLLVSADGRDRFHNASPQLESHGSEFAETMLDLIQACWGIKSRMRMYAAYRCHGVPCRLTLPLLGRSGSSNDCPSSVRPAASPHV